MRKGHTLTKEARLTVSGSAETKKTMSICKNYPGDNGYYQVGLVKKGLTRNRVTRKVHTLVCLAFVGPQPTELHTVNHKNGNKLDNSSENLEWMTRSEQSIHSYNVLNNIESRPRGHGNHWRANYTDDEVREIRKLHANGMSYHKIAAYFGNKTTWVPIQFIVKRKTYAHVK